MKKTSETCRKILRKIIIGLGLSTGALAFQTCQEFNDEYGPGPAMGLNVLIQGTVKSTTNDPIKGIKVSANDLYQYDLTDDAGEFQIYVPWENFCTIRFEDIDGEENGSYKTKEISVELSKNKINREDISLDAE
jgi:putative lipoprotein (rSAM/lipoprotein system)